MLLLLLLLGAVDCLLCWSQSGSFLELTPSATGLCQLVYVRLESLSLKQSKFTKIWKLQDAHFWIVRGGQGPFGWGACKPDKRINQSGLMTDLQGFQMIIDRLQTELSYLVGHQLATEAAEIGVEKPVHEGVPQAIA